jgi:hypothetical protein
LGGYAREPYTGVFVEESDMMKVMVDAEHLLCGETGFFGILSLG